MSDEPVLEVGSSGRWVAYLEQSLAHLGYWNGDDADYFTDDLRHAVLRFQTDKGLPADGLVGPKTWEAMLYGANACEPPARSDGGVVGAGTARLVSRQGGIAEVTGWPHDVIKP
jgi:peptidoglycan hydrolase-like protein with peptidoglycan-binding domain